MSNLAGPLHTIPLPHHTLISHYYTGVLPTTGAGILQQSSISFPVYSRKSGFPSVIASEVRACAP